MVKVKKHIKKISKININRLARQIDGEDLEGLVAVQLGAFSLSEAEDKIIRKFKPLIKYIKIGDSFDFKETGTLEYSRSIAKAVKKGFKIYNGNPSSDSIIFVLTKLNFPKIDRIA